MTVIFEPADPNNQRGCCGISRDNLRTVDDPPAGGTSTGRALYDRVTALLTIRGLLYAAD